MRTRSYNEEMKIALAQFMDAVCNDVTIVRKKGTSSQTIKVLSMFGDRQKVFKQLENSGKSIVLPMMAISVSQISRDYNRVNDLNKFLTSIPDINSQNIDEERYREIYNEFCPVPITIEFKMHILAKYLEDFDQIVSNFMAVFNPSIYTISLHPKIPDARTTNIVEWGGSFSTSFDGDTEIKNVCEYACETSFNYNTWIYPGTSEIVKHENGIIEKINWHPELIQNSDMPSTFTVSNFHAVPNSIIIDGKVEDMTFDMYEERIIAGKIKYPLYDWLPMYAYSLSGASGYFTSEDTYNNYLSENPGVDGAFLGYYHAVSGLTSGGTSLLSIMSTISGDYFDSFVAGDTTTLNVTTEDGSNLILFDGFIASPSVQAADVRGILSMVETDLSGDTDKDYYDEYFNN